MVSSGRQARGEAYSVLAQLMAHIGIQGFIESLEEFADAAFIDNRVLLAHHRSWPPRRDRFYSDLGMGELVSDPWLREFSQAAYESSIPVILGGHGLVAGDMLAFTKIIEMRNRNAPD